MPSHRKLADAALAAHGRTFAQELGIPLSRDTPAPLYRWLVAATLLSARISHDIAIAAADALSNAGWRTPRAMADATWDQRTKVLNRSGYARYDERTSRMLGDGAAHLLDAYRGDLRRLRARADEDPAAERRLLKDFKGIGDVGADIFFREAQAVWPEHRPFADSKALKAAGKLGLPEDAKELARLVSREELPWLLCALVRIDLAKDYDAVRARAE